MKLIKPNFEIITQNPNNDGMLKHIELCGRVAWKSEERITDNSHIKFVDMLKGLNHCYAEGTELLTKQGWVKFDNYNKEEVAVVNLDGTLKGFEYPINFIKDSFSGNFYKYETLGLEVTDGHKMFGMLANKDTDRYKNFSGELFECNKEYFDANKRKKTYGERWFKTLSAVKSYSYLLPMYQLIGFWLGDGCINDSKNVLDFHLRKKRKVKYLESICKSLNFNYKYEKEHFRIYKEDINKYFITNFTKGKIKYIDENIINNSEIFSIIDGLINSDGNIGKTCTRISNKSDYIINFLLNKGCLCGYNVIESSKTSNDVRNVLILRTNTRIVNDSRKPLSKVKIENKTKNVYCITVSTGLIIVRGSNGVTTICGNCSVLEHGTVYLHIKDKTYNVIPLYEQYKENKYSKASLPRCNEYDAECYVTTNYRVLVENNWVDDLKYQCEPTEFHEKRITVKFICTIGISREFNRHRVHSITEQSTRYCNYSKDKFGNEVTFIKPLWYVDRLDRKDYAGSAEENYEMALKQAEQSYFALLDCGWKPEQAREVLPLNTATELIHTAFISDWKHFFELRCSKAAHPQSQELAIPLEQEFKKLNLI